MRPRLVERAAGAGPVSGVVTLRPGRGRPLFLVADALGTTAGCRELAEALCGDRPVYGLEPVEAGGSARIEDLATQHADAVLATGPGPYLVGGWSFGAVVAHELARQLVERGEPVDKLVCLDGFVPPARRLAADPVILRDCLRLQAGVALGVGPVGGMVRRSPRLRRRFLANISLLLRYRPRPVACRAVVFKAGVDLPAAARLRRRLSPLYREVLVLPAGGRHWSMLRQPHVTALAAKLSSELERAKT